jgi:hypothetical protein
MASRGWERCTSQARPTIAARPETDSATIEAAFGEIQESSWSLPYYALAVLGFVGGMLAATVAVAIEGMIPDNAYFIASSALFLVAGIVVAVQLRSA